MSSNYPELVFTADEDFDEKRLNQAMEVIDQRLRALEPFSPAWEAAVNELRLFGLDRLNQTIQPAYDRVLQLATFGFLVAPSSTSITLAQDTDATFIIDEGPQRDLFTPTPFLAITREGSADDYAIAARKSYDKDTGVLIVTIKSVSGNVGPFTDWWIGAVAGTTIAGMSYLTQIKALRDEVLAGRNVTITNAAQTTQDRLTTAQLAEDALTAKNAAQLAAAGLESVTADGRSFATAMAIALG
jgi:hypothetical protein